MTDLATLESSAPPPWFSAGPKQATFPPSLTLLAADQLGAARDGVSTAADLAAYQQAFRAIDADPAHLLVVRAGRTSSRRTDTSRRPDSSRRTGRNW